MRLTDIDPPKSVFSNTPKVFDMGPWPGSGNQLTLRNGSQPTCNQLYSQYASPTGYKILCTVTNAGRVIRDGVDITDNDAAMTQCFVEHLQQKGIEVKRGN